MPLITFLSFFLLFSCQQEITSTISGNAEPPSHTLWDELLQKHVNEEGWVDYEGVIRDSTQLSQYLQSLEANPPNKRKWSREAQMAYWINAYNAYTIKIVADNYPVKSIKDIGPAVSIPFVNTVWDIRFIRIGGEKLDLNKIEHKKLRKEFEDPRIHFAIVCASFSCPRLLNRAYTAEQLDQQLDMMARDFLADKRKNRLSPEKLELSKILNWYKMDFTGKEYKDIRDYIRQYTDVKFGGEVEIEWLEYDWSLNEQKK